MTQMEVAFRQLLDMLEQNGHLHWWQRKQIAETLNAPPVPVDPMGCKVCGANGFMGYVCPRRDCPSAMRVTS